MVGLTSYMIYIVCFLFVDVEYIQKPMHHIEVEIQGNGFSLNS